MIFAPVQILVKLVAVLPDVVRPGAFVGLVVAILWFVFVQRGLPNLWHALCRGAARLVDIFVGLVLLPDYLVTTARQKQGEKPGQATLAISGVAERVLESVGGLYQRHQRDPIKWKPFPLIPVAVTIAVLTIPWVVMDLSPGASSVRRELASAYDVWRDVEGWAGVDPSRRAAPGVAWPPRPQLVGSRRNRRIVSMTVHCPRDVRCEGRAIIRNGRKQRLRSRLVAVRPKVQKTVHMRLSRSEAMSNYISIRIARANPR